MPAWKQETCAYLLCFPDYTPPSGNDDILNGSSVRLARLYVRVVPVLTCLEQNEKRVVQRQKVYADTFKSQVSEPIKSVIGHVQRFV